MRLKQRLEKFFNIRAQLHQPDRLLLIVVAVVIVFGLVMLSSASGGYAYTRYDDGYYFLKHQSFALLIGLGLFWLLSNLDYHRLRKYSLLMLFLSISLLLLVFVPGLSSSANFKARSWISIAGFSLQPSEFVKLTFLIYLSGWLEGRGKQELEDFKQGIQPLLMVLGAIAFLMFAQPDFGTFIIIALTSLMVFYVAGGKLSHLIGIGLAGLLFLAIAFQLKPYQQDRINCYLNPERNAGTECYQLRQSLIAVGSGGIWGRGFGESRQKMMYLPEVSGDSIFAIISEELGFLFSASLIICFIILFWRGCKIALRAPDNFGRAMSVGIVSWLTIQALINIGGMINLIPMTGVPLPFVSYGGSSVLAAMAAIGVLTNISKQTRLKN